MEKLIVNVNKNIHDIGMDSIVYNMDLISRRIHPKHELFQYLQGQGSLKNHQTLEYQFGLCTLEMKLTNECDRTSIDEYTIVQIAFLNDGQDIINPTLVVKSMKTLNTAVRFVFDPPKHPGTNIDV